MKKLKFIVLVLFGTLSFSLQAQMNISVSAGVQFPSSNLGDGLKPGAGFNLAAKYMAGKNVAIGLNLGYIKFGADSYELFDGSGYRTMPGYGGNIIPVTGLLEIHFGNERNKTYIGADVGMYLNRVKYVSIINGDETISYEFQKVFGFAPTAGAIFGISEIMDLLINIKYHNMFFEENRGSWIGLTAGLIFKI